MLTLLNISNIALIDDLRVEFETGLNLLTGETGSGKSIIVDALGLLMGGRLTGDLLKAGSDRGFIEGMFSVRGNAALEARLADAGIQTDESEAGGLIIRREISATGRNKIFINNQLGTGALLRELRPFLVDIHGQGDQQTLFDIETHLELLDTFADARALRLEVGASYDAWSSLEGELREVTRDEAEKLQLADVLRFQIDELQRADFSAGEDEKLEEERRRLMNVEKLRTLGGESFGLIYEDGDSALTRIKQAARRIEELGEYDSRFTDYLDMIESARAGLEDLALSLRDFNDKIEFSPERLAEVESRLAELARLKRKYGGSTASALEHLAQSEARLRNIEHADEREAELRKAADDARKHFVAAARKLERERTAWAKKLARAVESDLAEVAMEHARFEVGITTPTDRELTSPEGTRFFTARGINRVEFLFSANPGEPVKPLVKVASGGEASRLMLVLKTIAGAAEFPRTIVFDEIDSGIGGRVSEAVGAKLKRLSQTNQVLCVTHQPQIARFADAHLLVQKTASALRTRVVLEKLDRRGRVEELARMLTGAEITESARRHARELLKAEA